MGKRSLADLVAPAISMAEEGVQWTPVAAALTREAETLLRQWNGRLPYLPDDRLPKAGERLQLPGLAKLLAEFASAGPMLFHGRVGEVVVEHLGALGGFVAREDFLRAVACTMPPLVTNLPDGARLSQNTPPTQGPVPGEAFTTQTRAMSD